MTRSTMHKTGCGVYECAPTFPAVRRVCFRLRQSDRNEVFAVMKHENLELLSDYQWSLHKADQLAYFKMFAIEDADNPLNELPVAFLAITKQSPGVGGVTFLATDEFAMIAHALTKHLKQTVIPHLFTIGLNRVEVRALASEAASCRWIKYLGATFETDVPMLGKNGETFKQFAWTQPAIKTDGD